MEKYNGKATASLVLGIISVALAWFGYSAIAGLVCGIIGLVLSIQIKKAGEIEGFAPDGKSNAGLVLGIIGVILNGIMFVACVACASALGVAANSLTWY